MSDETVSFCYGQRQYCAHIERRARETLAIEVLPDCTIRAIAPVNASQEQLRERLRKRARWIERQLNYFGQFQPRTPPRRFVGGETHLYLGRQYLLKLHVAEASLVVLTRGRLHVHCKGGDFSLAGRLLWRWYRQKAQVKFAERLAQCMARFPQAAQPALAIRRLKKRWGSLAPSGLLTLNLDLIRAPVECIDYVITHELCHIEQPHHGRKFLELLSDRMPDWRERKHRLELRLS